MKEMKTSSLLTWLNGALGVMVWVLVFGLVVLSVMLVLGLLGVGAGTAHMEWSAMGLRLEVPGAEFDGLFFTVSSGMGIGMAVFGLMILLRCRSIIRRVILGTPFHPNQGRDMRWIAWLILASEAFQTAAQVFVASRIGSVLQAAAGPVITADATVSLRPEVIFLGLIILVLAQIFSYGSAMEEEQRYTV